MQHKKYVIIGGGISGLSAAKFLGSDDCVVLEKEQTPGGYCKTKIEGDYVWDYAGHFFHFKDKTLENWFLSNIPEAGRVFNKKCTKILLKDGLIDYPFQTHIHQLDKADLIRCVTGLILDDTAAGNDFLSMLYRNYGSGIVELFLKPYNEKLYACNLNTLDKNAMGRFFPAADKKQIFQAMRGKDSASYNDYFWYPKQGAQAIIDVLVRDVQQLGVTISCGAKVNRIDVANKLVYTDKEVYQYDYLINTTPLHKFWQTMASPFPALPEDFSYNKVLVLNLGFEKGVDPSSGYAGLHWLYVPETKYNFYRVGFYNHILHQEKLSLYVEVGFDSATDIDVERELELAMSGLSQIGIVSGDNPLVASQTIIMEPAYVHINTAANGFLQKWMPQLAQENIYSIGRYGHWTYCSMEDCILEAKTVASTILNGGGTAYDNK